MWTKIKKLWRFDNLLDEAWKESFRMLKICHTMFLEAVRVLRETHDTQINIEIRKKDKLVNQYEREVRKKVLTHLSVQSPSGLPEGMVLVSIVIDMERLGDYTKNIVDLAQGYLEILHGGKFEQDLQEIEAAVKDFFEKTITALQESDQPLAIELLRKYKWVNPKCDERLMDLVKETDKNITPGQAAALALYFRWLKRINSHLRNITTSVVNPFHRIGFKPKKKKYLP
ncbi:MAG: phosphate signaling complex protein PhoU [Calditrichia bacterium]